MAEEVAEEIVAKLTRWIRQGGRVLTGWARFEDGWRVVQDYSRDGELVDERAVYDPAYPTEGEAESKAGELARIFRSVSGDPGGELSPPPMPTVRATGLN